VLAVVLAVVLAAVLAAVRVLRFKAARALAAPSEAFLASASAIAASLIARSAAEDALSLVKRFSDIVQGYHVLVYK
jgi:hypothetical protein